MGDWGGGEEEGRGKKGCAGEGGEGGEGWRGGEMFVTFTVLLLHIGRAHMLSTISSMLI